MGGVGSSWVVQGEVPGINTPTAEQGATGHLPIDYHSLKSYRSIFRVYSFPRYHLLKQENVLNGKRRQKPNNNKKNPMEMTRCCRWDFPAFLQQINQSISWNEAHLAARATNRLLNRKYHPSMGEIPRGLRADFHRLVDRISGVNVVPIGFCFKKHWNQFLFCVRVCWCLSYLFTPFFFWKYGGNGWVYQSENVECRSDGTQRERENQQLE